MPAAKMRAAVVYCPNRAVIDNPNDALVRRAMNTCYSMGMDVVLWSAQDISGARTLATWEAMIASDSVDLVVGVWSGGNGDDSIRYISNGDCSVPVFILNCTSTFSARVPGMDSQQGSNAAYTGTIVSTGATIYPSSFRYTLATPTGDEEITGLVQDADNPTWYGAWKYHPDTTDSTKNYVYLETGGINGFMLHILVQEAINDGVMSAPPKKSPIFLLIDHINSSGNGSGGGDAGTVGQPEIISYLGELLRDGGGVCYANIEQNPVETAKHTAVQIANLVEYDDVFKYLACHDHSDEDLTNGTYLTTSLSANDAIDNQETKAAIIASYNSTSTVITGLGLTVNTGFAHFAGDSVGPNWYEANRDEGWGFKACRVSATGDHTQSYPASTGDAVHWMHKKNPFIGVVAIPSRDGDAENGDIVDATKDSQTLDNLLKQFYSGQVTYFHETDFEIASENPSGTISDGTAFARGRLYWTMGKAYQEACPDCVNWGADINDYL